MTELGSFQSITELESESHRLEELYRQYWQTRQEPGVNPIHDNPTAKRVAEEIISLEKTVFERFGVTYLLNELQAQPTEETARIAASRFQESQAIRANLQRISQQYVGTEKEGRSTLMEIDEYRRDAELLAEGGISFAVLTSGPGESARVFAGKAGMLHPDIRQKIVRDNGLIRRPDASGYCITIGGSAYVVVDNYRMIWPQGLELTPITGFGGTKHTVRAPLVLEQEPLTIPLSATIVTYDFGTRNFRTIEARPIDYMKKRQEMLKQLDRVIR